MTETRRQCLPKSVVNRIFEVLKVHLTADALARLSLLRGPDGGQPTDSSAWARQMQDDLRNALAAIQTEELDSEQVSRFAHSLSLVLGAFVDRSHLVIAVDTVDIQNVVLTLVRLLLNGGDLERVVMTTGMGGTEYLPSVRLPAYIVPALLTLSALENLREQRIIRSLPMVRVFKANHISSALNGYDLQRVIRVSELSFRFLREFLQRYYPQFEDRFVFESDFNWVNASDRSVDTAIREGASVLESLTDPECLPVIAKIKKMGSKHGGESGCMSALRYAAAHPLYNQALVTRNGLPISEFTVLNPKPDLIVDHGGEPQDAFNRLGNALRDALTGKDYACTPLLNILHRAGKTPVYYRARGGDLILGDEPHLDHLDHRAKEDLRIIFKVVNHLDYFDFVREFNNKHMVEID